MKRNLEKLASQNFDVLVIGGGVHGALIAWDAALRGLSVALIERGDFGSATSQNSLKIIHGGLRYLQDFNITRIRTMARERTTWMRIAPHLVHPLVCLTPTRSKISRSRLAMAAALVANDLLSFDRNRLNDTEKYLPAGKIISAPALAHLLPGYNVDTSTGAAIWNDAQVYNTERLLLEFIISAVGIGAEVANYVEAISLLRRGEKVEGVSAKDMLSEQVFEIRSRMVINCTGAWIDNLLEDVSIQSGYATSIALNIIVDQVWERVAAGLPARSVDGRPSQILFFVPWRGKTIIGTKHFPWKGTPDSFKLHEKMIQDFLDEINSAHPPLDLSLDDVLHVTWGFLPMHENDVHRQAVRLTRDGVLIDHENRDDLPGLVSALGVKYTTARLVAEKAVDLAVDKLHLKKEKSQTALMPVDGGRIEDFNAFLTQATADTTGILDADIVRHLVYTYGSEYSKVVKYIMDEPELAERIDPNLPVTAAEVMHALQNEMPLTLTDVVQRRTELGAAGLPSIKTLQKCAELMGREKGWSLERQEQEVNSVIQSYPFHLNAERVTA